MDEKTGTEKDSVNPIGIYGWRKRCLYFLILLLVAIIIVNIALTAWILVVLRFNAHGMGNLHITDDGLQVQGQAEFIDTLHTSKITSDENSHLQIDSSSGITIQALDSELDMTGSSIKLTTDSLTVKSNRNSEDFDLLSVDPSGDISMSVSSLVMGGAEGVSTASLQTSQVHGPAAGRLEISGGSEGLSLSANGSMAFEAKGGPVDVIAAGNITLSSSSGSIVISADVVLDSVPVAAPLGSGQVHDNVYHLCICPSGKLYQVLASPGNTQGCLTATGFC